MITAGVQSLPAPDYLAVLSLVQTFTEFTPDNDPWNEHDFGAVEHKKTKYFWKIDYYDRSLQGGSPDPTDPKQTTRVLTIMRADEY